MWVLPIPGSEFFVVLYGLLNLIPSPLFAFNSLFSPGAGCGLGEDM